MMATRYVHTIQRFGNACRRHWTRVVVLGLLIATLVAILIVTSPQRIALIDSDSLYSVSLYRDLFTRHYPIDGWHLTPAPYFFPDIVVIWSFLAFLRDPGYAFTAYAVFFFLTLLVLFGVLVSMVTQRRTTAFSSVFILAILVLGLFQGDTYFGLDRYSLTPTMHGGSLLLGTALLTLFFHMWKRGPSLITSTVFCITAAVGLASDFILLPWFLFPMLLAGVSLALFHKMPMRTPILTIGLVLASLLTAKGVLWYVQHTGLFVIPAVPVGDVSTSITAFFHNSPALLKNHGSLWSLNALLYFGLFVLYFCRKKLSRKDIPTDVHWQTSVLLFLLILYPLMIVTTLIALSSQQLLDLALNATTIRYYQSFYLIPLMFGGILAVFLQHEVRRRWWLTACLATFLIIGIRVWPELRSFTSSQLRLPYPPSIRCLDDLAVSQNLRFGYGDYWSAKYISELSRGGVWVNRLSDDLTRADGISNPFWYFTLDNENPDMVRYPDYHFVVTNRLDTQEIIKRFGAPDNRHQCGNYLLWIYSQPLQNKKVKNRCIPVAPLSTFRTQGNLARGEDGIQLCPPR